MALTYTKAISDITDNKLVLSICKTLAETMAVPYSRVTDAYGGYYLNPSPSLPSSAAVASPAKATNTTAATKTATTKTRLLNTTNTT